MYKRLWKAFESGLKSNYGTVNWKVGEWQEYEDNIKLCESGFHASERIVDAMQYTNLELLARVEVKGLSKKGIDKQVWSKMKIIKLYDWTKEDSVSLAVFAAELCLDKFEKADPDDKRPREAINAAKDWFMCPTSFDVERAARAARVASAASAAWAAWAESAESDEKTLNKCEKYILKRLKKKMPVRGLN